MAAFPRQPSHVGLPMAAPGFLRGGPRLPPKARPSFSTQPSSVAAPGFLPRRPQLLYPAFIRDDSPGYIPSSQFSHGRTPHLSASCGYPSHPRPIRLRLSSAPDPGYVRPPPPYEEPRVHPDSLSSSQTSPGLVLCLDDLVCDQLPAHLGLASNLPDSNALGHNGSVQVASNS